MIWTSSFWRCGWDPRGVSVAKQVPKVFAGGACPELTPTWAELARFRQRLELVGRDGAMREFNREFNRRLAKLDAQKIARELDNCILLCWEHSDEFCHRRNIRQWLRAHRVPCEEIVCHEGRNPGHPRRDPRQGDLF